MTYGLIESIFKDPRDWFYGDGNIPFVPYQPDSSWLKFLVRFERQSTPRFETYNCTGFTVTTQIEIQEKRLYGIENNYSDRWVGIIAGTKPFKGNDPQAVYEAIREYGLIPEDMLPFDDDIKTAEEFFSFKGADKEKCYAEGRKWLEKNDFKHDWIWKGARPANYRTLIKEAQQTCPIAVSVSAWNKVNDEYVSYGDVNNHFTLGVAFPDGEREEVFDTYLREGTNLKLLSKDHNIRRAKRIYLNKKTPSALKKHISILQWVVDFLKKKKV